MPEEVETARESFLGFLFNSMGFLPSVLLLLSALLSFVCVAILVVRGRGPMSAAGLVLFVPVPGVLGLLLGLYGALTSYSVIARSAVAPKPAEVAAGISISLIAPLVGLLLILPALTLGSVGALIRSLMTEPTRPAS